jgi:hypothetical protein
MVRHGLYECLSTQFARCRTYFPRSDFSAAIQRGPEVFWLDFLPIADEHVLDTELGDE